MFLLPASSSSPHNTEHHLQMSYDEHVLAQERELEKLMKKTAASRLALLRNQSHMMVLLEQALKGWFNPKKVRHAFPAARACFLGQVLGLPLTSFAVC